LEYEFKEVKPHPDIRVSPLVGEIDGNSQNIITFKYFPSTFTTAEAEFQLRTSEFDFEPQVIRIIGSAIPQKVDAQQFYQGDSLYQADQMEEESEEGSVIRRKNRTLLTDKSTRP